MTYGFERTEPSINAELPDVTRDIPRSRWYSKRPISEE